eukprot:TRINITY_DN20825_c0_g1_i7.p2 TRINITY_DN20825_c0_g1~~TRINITY_DN20825_c0_g1_i7.p2  ORF type:complete len:125 (-),score=45.79 TRINITY_DN20825_c0_g1_i7:343-717(-)
MLLTQCEGPLGSWEECQQSLSQLKDKMSNMEAFITPRTCTMAQSVEAVKATLAGANLPELARTHCVISILVDWALGAVEVAEASLEVRKAAKAEAEETGDEYTEQVEDDITDKPAEAEEPTTEE